MPPVQHAYPFHSSQCSNPVPSNPVLVIEESIPLTYNALFGY